MRFKWSRLNRQTGTRCFRHDVRAIAITGIARSPVSASGMALAAMIHGAGKFEWNWFCPWVLAPYGILLVVFGLPQQQSDARALAGCVAAVLMLWAMVCRIKPNWLYSSYCLFLFIFPINCSYGNRQRQWP